MADHEGDPSKQPPECKSVFIPFSDENPRKPGDFGQGRWTQCPNIESTYDGFDGERYGCKVCGKSYFLDYDDMK